MNKDMENKKYYQNTFDEVHASDDLLGKVKNMKDERISRKIRKVGRFAYIVAAVLIVIISSNIISYAATGSTWVEKVTAPSIKASSSFIPTRSTWVEKVIENIGRQEVEMDKYIDDDEVEYLEGNFVINDDECVIIRPGDDISELDLGFEIETEFTEDGKEIIHIKGEGKDQLHCGYNQEVLVEGDKMYVQFIYTEIDREGDNVNLKVKSKKIDITNKIKDQKYYCMTEIEGITYYWEIIIKDYEEGYFCFISQDRPDNFRELTLYTPFPEDKGDQEIIVEEDRVYLIIKNMATDDVDEEGDLIIVEEQQKIDITDQLKDGDYRYLFDKEGSIYYCTVYKDKSGSYSIATSWFPPCDY